MYWQQKRHPRLVHHNETPSIVPGNFPSISAAVPRDTSGPICENHYMEISIVHITLRTVRIAHALGNDFPLENCPPNLSRENRSGQIGGQIGN